MKGLILAAMLAAQTTPAIKPVGSIPPATAKPTVAVNSPAVKPKEGPHVVTLTPFEIRVLIRAMALAATQCSDMPDGCIIGENKAALTAKLNGGH